MTPKSPAEIAADLHYGQVTTDLWCKKKITSNKDSFIGGCKFMLDEAEKILEEMTNAEFPASDADIRGAFILKNKLKKLLGGEG